MRIQIALTLLKGDLAIPTTHSSVLAWRIPGMGEPGGLPSMGSHRVGHDSSDLAAAVQVAVFLPLRWSPGTAGSLEDEKGA